MRDDKKENSWGYPPAIAIGFFLGMIGGLLGMFAAEMIGFGREDTIYMIGGFGGLAVALFMNKIARKQMDDYEDTIHRLKEYHQEQIKGLSKSD